jgi:hypothetical protein
MNDPGTRSSYGAGFLPHFHICSFPVTDVGPSKDWMVKVIDACTALINSQGV